LRVGQALTDYAEFNASFKALHGILTNPTIDERDLKFGASLVRDIILRVVSDMTMALGVKAISTIVSKIAKAFREVGEEAWRSHAKKKKTEAEHTAKKQIANQHGYASENILKKPKDVQLLDEEARAHGDWAAENQKIIVLREGKADRMTVMRSQVWVEGKSTWLKAKTSDGWHGMVCVKKASGIESKALKRAQVSYDMGNLKGISPEIDAYIKANPKRPMFEFPTDGRKIDGIDYGGAGKGNVQMEGHFAVDLGDRYMVVNKTKGPYVGDNDIAMIYDPKVPKNQQFKDRADARGRPLANPEDNLSVEYNINQRIWNYLKYKTGRLYNSAQHGGDTGSGGHAQIQGDRGNKFWSPVDKNGKWEQERLIIWLPMKGPAGQKVSQMFVIESWPQFKQFWKDNNFKWPDGW
jgi:hypothetical protein